MYGGHVIVMNNDMTNYLIENSLVRLNSYFCHGERIFSETHSTIAVKHGRIQPIHKSSYL